MAAHLAFQLERLEAMRTAAAQLMARDQLGRDFFRRGMEEAVVVRRQTTWAASLSDLLRAYAQVKTKEASELPEELREGLDRFFERLNAE